MPQADDGAMCAKARVLEVPAALRDAVGAESQGWLSWRVLDARVNDVESLQGFDLSSEMIAERLLVIARVKDGLGWKKLSRKLLLVIGSGGCRMEGVQSHPRGTDSVLCRGDISHDG